MTVYDSTIEVSLEPVFEDNREKNDESIRQLRTLRRKYDPMPQDLARKRLPHTGTGSSRPPLATRVSLR
jgi:hypothetical protein